MTQHVTIALDEQELSRARALAQQLGVSVEEYLQQIVRGHLPPPANAAPHERPLTGTIEDIFDLFPVDDGPPTDIGRDKDKMIGEAVWQEHLRKTRQSE